MNASPKPEGNPANAAARADQAHLTALDGIRGVAITMVIWVHTSSRCNSEYSSIIEVAYRRFARFGLTGVDLFFVLSGFLITGILLRTRGRRGYLGCFYARRALRTFPLYYTLLAVVFLVLPVALRDAHPWPMCDRQAWYWTFSFNWWVGRNGQFPGGDFLNPLWSLGVEEQFYLIWPFVVMWLSPPGVLRAAIIVATAAVGVRAWGNAHGWPHDVLDTGTFSRMDGLSFGAVLAAVPFCNVDRANVLRWSARAAAVAGVILIGFFVIERTVVIDGSTLGQAAVEVIAAWVVAHSAWSRHVSVLQVALRAPVLRWLGTRSYGLYLLHLPIAYVITQHWTVHRILSPIPNHLAFFAAVLAVSATVAELSWRCLERPMLGLKRWFVVAGPRESVAPVTDHAAVAAA